MKIDFVPSDPSNYYAGRGGNSIRYIVVHYTANDGDTDQGNAHYFQGANRGASAHYFVDEDSVTQSVRDEDGAWHCGGALESSHHPLHGICMNRNSIGVEMCSDIRNGKYAITAETVNRTVELVRYLMRRYNVLVDRVVRHYEVTGKRCPEPWVLTPQLWTDFKRRLEDDEMTRQEVQKMIDDAITAYAAGHDGDTPSGWAAAAWEKAKNDGITDGTAPQAPMTREQGIVMMQRAGLIGK